MPDKTAIDTNQGRVNKARVTRLEDYVCVWGVDYVSDGKGDNSVPINLLAVHG